MVGWAPRRGDKGAVAMSLGLVAPRQGEDEAMTRRFGFDRRDKGGEGRKMVAEVVVVV